MGAKGSERGVTLDYVHAYPHPYPDAYPDAYSHAYPPAWVKTCCNTRVYV